MRSRGFTRHRTEFGPRIYTARHGLGRAVDYTDASRNGIAELKAISRDPDSRIAEQTFEKKSPSSLQHN